MRISIGWPSRFDTWFKFAKELGLVYYQAGEKIMFSQTGGMLIDSGHPEHEQAVFLNALVKYQSNNPFRRVLNDNAPLILLLKTIRLLNGDGKGKGAGIGKWELPLLLYWKSSDADALCRRILRLRQEFGYAPSAEAVADICRQEIMDGEDRKRDIKSITMDYPDEFIRKMRLTGLVTLRGGGRFVDINQNEARKVGYILRSYSAHKVFASEREYFDYMATLDARLQSLASKPVARRQHDKFLSKWLSLYEWSKLKSELLTLSGRGESKDAILKFLPHSVRLEFLTALALKSQFPNVAVHPNYPVDDEGLPTSTAAGAGDTGDIECFEDGNGVLVEVTMAEGTTQTKMEIWPICRYLEAFGGKASNAICHFVAPSVFTDSLRQIAFVKSADGLRIYPRTIAEFVRFLEKSDKLHSTA